MMMMMRACPPLSAMRTRGVDGFLLLLLLLLVVLLLQPPVVAFVSAAGAVPAPWQDVFALDCQGNMRFFPSNPLLAITFNATILTHAYAYATNALSSRLT